MIKLVEKSEIIMYENKIDNEEITVTSKRFYYSNCNNTTDEMTTIDKFAITRVDITADKRNYLAHILAFIGSLVFMFGLIILTTSSAFGVIPLVIGIIIIIISAFLIKFKKNSSIKIYHNNTTLKFNSLLPIDELHKITECIFTIPKPPTPSKPPKKEKM